MTASQQTGWTAAQAAVAAIAVVVSIIALFATSQSMETADRINRIEAATNLHSAKITALEKRVFSTGNEFHPRPWRNPGRIGSSQSD